MTIQIYRLSATNSTTVDNFTWFIIIKKNNNKRIKKPYAVKFYNTFCNKVYKYKPFAWEVENSPVLTIFAILGDDVTFDVGVIDVAFVEPILTLQTAITQKISFKNTNS